MSRCDSVHSEMTCCTFTDVSTNRHVCLAAEILWLTYGNDPDLANCLQLCMSGGGGVKRPQWFLCRQSSSTRVNCRSGWGFNLCRHSCGRRVDIYVCKWVNYYWRKSFCAVSLTQWDYFFRFGFMFLVADCYNTHCKVEIVPCLSHRLDTFGCLCTHTNICDDAHNTTMAGSMFRVLIQTEVTVCRTVPVLLLTALIPKCTLQYWRLLFVWPHQWHVLIRTEVHNCVCVCVYQGIRLA